MLREITGRLSWAAGIVPRSRWAVSIFYGVVTDALRAQQSGVEMARQQARKYRRDKSHLVAVSRLGLALHWAAKFWAHENLWTRRLALKPEVSLFTPFVDASPWGIGGVFMGSDGSILEYFADTISGHDVEILGIEIGSCRGQAILEALAILVALYLWQSLLVEMKLSLKDEYIYYLHEHL